MCYDFNIDTGGGGERGEGVGDIMSDGIFRIVLAPAGFPNFCNNFRAAL